MPLYVTVKLVPGVRAVIAMPPTRVAKVLLQVTPSGVLSVSSEITVMVLLAVTAVELTVRATLVTPVGIATKPAADAPHTAGDAEDEHLVAVPRYGGYQRVPFEISGPAKYVVPVLRHLSPLACATAVIETSIG